MSGGHGPRSMEEMQEAEEIKAAERLHESIKGFYLTDPFNNKIEGERLGVRHELEHALEHEHHKNAQDVILDARVTEQLRQKVKEHKQHEKTGWRFVPGSKEWRKNRVTEIKNAGRTLKNPLRWFRDDYDEYSAEIEHEYGHATDVEKMKTHLSGKLSSLIPAGLPQTEIDRLNAMVGVAPGATAVDANLLIKTSPLQLEEIQRTLKDSAGAPVFNSRSKNFERLLELRRIESVEKSKVLSMYIFDAHRLRQFVVDKLEGAAPGTVERNIFDALEGNLGKDFYNHFHGDHKKLAALARIESHFETGDRAKLLTWLQEVKTEVADKLPETKTEQTEKEKENTLKIDEGYSKLKKTASDLMKKYRESLTIPDKITELDKELVKIRDAKAKAAAKGAVLSDQLESDVSRELRQTQQRQKDLPIEIQDLEQQYKDDGNDYILFLKTNPKVTLGSRLTEVETATQFTPADLSDSTTIFDKTKSSKMQKHIQTFITDRKFSNELADEIKKFKSTTFKPPLSADHLLLELNIRATKELKDEHGHPKFTDENQILKIARMSTSFEQIDAKNVELFRAGNRMIAESKLKGWKGIGGIWRKSKQQVASTFFNSDTFKGRDVIEHIAGLDHAFECFKDLPMDASLSDIRNAIKHHGGMSTENLMKFYLHLSEAVKGFTVNHTRTVKIADRDWPIEQVALFAQYVHAEIEAREFCHKIEHPDNDEDKKMKKDKKAQYFQKLLNARDESMKKMETDHLEQMRNPDSNWQVSFVKSLMKGKFGEAYEKALAAGKEKGLSGQALKDYVSAEGSIPKTVLKHLMTGLALKEAWDIGSSGVKWVGSKLGKASSKAAKFGVEKGGGILAAAWQRLGRPAITGVGKGIVYAGKGIGKGIWKGGKFIAYDTPKFFFWDAPKWTVKTTAKALWWPFRMVGKGAAGFWNFFHYTEEKRAKDAAWYAAKKAHAAASGGHGGGHGGGGHGGGH